MRLLRTVGRFLDAPFPPTGPTPIARLGVALVGFVPVLLLATLVPGLIVPGVVGLAAAALLPVGIGLLTLTGRAAYHRRLARWTGIWLLGLLGLFVASTPIGVKFLGGWDPPAALASVARPLLGAWIVAYFPIVAAGQWPWTDRFGRAVLAVAVVLTVPTRLVLATVPGIDDAAGVANVLSETGRAGFALLAPATIWTLVRDRLPRTVEARLPG